MSGITDEPFRQRAYAHGAGLVVSEMVASGELAKGRAGCDLRIRHSGLPVHMVQLAGREAAHMAEGARIAAGEGADIIDINMGCPAKKVTGGYAGSALMRDLDHALSLIEAVVGAVEVPVTVKMRLGWDEGALNAPMLARRAEQAGVRMVTVHGRTRCQFYQGKADWRAIARVKEAVSIPVVANGDVGSPAEAADILDQSGADAVMIGRAHYGAPWTAGSIAAAAAGEAAPGVPDKPEGTGRLRRRPLRGHAGALRRRKRPAPGAQASWLVSRPSRRRRRRRPAQGHPHLVRARCASLPRCATCFRALREAVNLRSAA